MAYAVFISYRRKTAEDDVRLLQQSLKIICKMGYTIQ